MWTHHGNRLEILALRPSPIQITWLGFPGTTGADFIDYIIADKVIAPRKHAPFFSEKLIYLRRCYQINNNKIELSELRFKRQDFKLPKKGVVFVSFTQSQKIDPVMFNIWMNILKRVPDGTLWLWQQNQDATKNLRQEAKKVGVQPSRLVFSPRLPKSEHLARLALADLALDTRLYGGHTTTSDCLRAGVPAITKIGNHFASRVCASILTEAKLPELITHSLKEYEDKAVYLAQHPKELTKIRSKITHERLKKNLYDTEGFVRDLEKAYLKIVEIRRRGEAPRMLEIND